MFNTKELIVKSFVVHTTVFFIRAQPFFAPEKTNKFLFVLTFCGPKIRKAEKLHSET